MEKDFPTLVVASAVTGVGLGNISFSDVHECVEWLYGGPVWTHELIHKEIRSVYVHEAFKQFPHLPSREMAEQNWKLAAEQAEAHYGQTMTVARGSATRAKSPVQTALEVMEKVP